MRPVAQEGARNKLKERKSHQAGTGGRGRLGKPDPLSSGAALSIALVPGPIAFAGPPGAEATNQRDWLPFSTLNLSIQARKKQGSGDTGLSRGTEELHPPATTRMCSLLFCSHTDLGKTAQG